MRTRVYRVTLEEDEDGRWTAECPTLPGCATGGESFEDTLRNIREAVTVYVADVQEAGERLPPADNVIDGPAVSVVTVT